MSTTGIATFDSTVQRTNEWLHELRDELGLPDRQAAYHALRAVLHALRDRLSVDQTAALGSQLPLLIRGIFYEGWAPQHKPMKLRKKGDFLSHVSDQLGAGHDPEAVAHMVFAALSRHVSAGEMRHIKATFPKELRELFDEQPHSVDS